METEFEGVIEWHILMHLLTGPTLLFTASKSDLQHWRELNGGADTKGGMQTEFGRGVQKVCIPTVLMVQKQSLDREGGDRSTNTIPS